MSQVYLFAAIVLLLTIAVGIARLFFSRVNADRMLVAQLIGTTGTAVVLLLAFAMEQPEWISVALVLAVLAAVAAVAFVRQQQERCDDAD